MNYFKKTMLTAIANKIGTPCYVYSKMAILDRWHSFDKAFANYPHRINYAVKANSNLAILNIFASLKSGFDIVSIGELEKVLIAKGIPENIVFSGVGKTIEELSRALQVGVGCINIESKSELLRLNQLAVNLNKIAKIAIRVNPDVNVNSHPYISTGIKDSKFGVNISDVIELYKLAHALPGILIVGISFHLGSQIIELAPFATAIDLILEIINNLNHLNIKLNHVNVGGGLGVQYKDEIVPLPNQYIETLLLKLKSTNFMVYIEPGRSLVANAGVLLTKVEYIKQQNKKNKYFAIVDAGMNDLLRPALYEAWHEIVVINNNPNINSNNYDIVGPVCETADFLGKDRILAITENDLLMVCSVGAYSFSMSSNYNSRCRAAEVMIDGEEFYTIRKRESIEDLVKLERINLQ